MIAGTCPDCGGKRPLPDYLADAEARAALAAALDCPAPLARLIIPYMQLHSPPTRAMQMGKLTRLLRELSEMINAGTVTRGAETLPAPLAAWQAGLEQVLANRDAGSVTLPLSGHGYLCQIVHRAQAGAGARSARESRPTHASHRPFTAASSDSPAERQAESPADKNEALAAYRSTQRLLAQSGGAARTALKAQLRVQAGRLRALGVQLPDDAPPPPSPEDTSDEPAA